MPNGIVAAPNGFSVLLFEKHVKVIVRKVRIISRLCFAFNTVQFVQDLTGTYTRIRGN